MGVPTTGNSVKGKREVLLGAQGVIKGNPTLWGYWERVRETRHQTALHESSEALGVIRETRHTSRTVKIIFSCDSTVQVSIFHSCDPFQFQNKISNDCDKFQKFLIYGNS